MAIPVDPSAYMYYYNTGGGNNAPSESYYCGGMPTGINPYDNTHLDLYYPSIKGCSAVDTIRLTITAGKHKQISDILVKEFLKNNAAPVPVGQDPIITIFDGDKSPIYKIQQDILGVSITYGTGCSSGGGGSMSNWTLSDGSTTQQIDNAETVLFSDSTFVNNVVSATNTVTTSLSATGTPGSLNFLRGDNTWSAPPNTTYSVATSTALGLVELGSDTDLTTTYETGGTGTAGRTYPVQLNSDDQMAVSVPWVSQKKDQHIDTNLQVSAWNVAYPYVIYFADFRIYGTQYSSISGIANAVFNKFHGFKCATSAFTHIDVYGTSMAGLTAAQIAALGPGGLVKIILLRYAPVDGNTTISLSEQTLGTVAFSSTANQIKKFSFGLALSSSLAQGEYFGLALRYTVTSEAASGNLTSMIVSATARAYTA